MIETIGDNAARKQGTSMIRAMKLWLQMVDDNLDPIPVARAPWVDDFTIEFQPFPTGKYTVAGLTVWNSETGGNIVKPYLIAFEPQTIEVCDTLRVSIPRVPEPSTPTESDIERELEETLAKLSELVRHTPDWHVDVKYETVSETSWGQGHNSLRHNGWRTVTIRYFVDPRTTGSRQRQIGAASQ